MFGRSKTETDLATREIGLLGTDTRFEGTIRFSGTLRIDGVVVGDITSEPGSGSVLIINQDAVVQGDIVSDSVLISGRVEGAVHAQERVEIYRSGLLKGDVHTRDLMIEGGAEFQGHCHMDTDDETESGGDAPAAGGRSRRSSRNGQAAADSTAAPTTEQEGPARA